MNPITDGVIDFVSAAPTTGSLDVTWIHGAPSRRHGRDPKIQVHHYDEHTVILRQSKSVNYEAPYLYLLFGNDRAVLLEPVPPPILTCSRCARRSTGSSPSGWRNDRTKDTNWSSRTRTDTTIT